MMMCSGKHKLCGVPALKVNSQGQMSRSKVIKIKSLLRFTRSFLQNYTNIYIYIYLYFTKNMVVSDRLGETNKQTTKQIHRQINK